MRPLTNTMHTRTTTHGADVILVDLNLPRRAVLAAVAAIAKDFPGLKWLVLSVERLEEPPSAEVSGELCDVASYLPSAEIVDQLRNCIRRSVLDERATHSVFAKAEPLLHVAGRNGSHQHWPGVRLTRCEARILQMLTKGLSNKEIAQQLCLSPYTVKNHVHHILDKLKVRNRIEAAMVLMGGSN
jgi:DNA-binding NarL/FixJ family response regulator